MIAGIVLAALLTIVVPENIVATSQQVADMYGIHPELLQAMAFRESSFNTNAENGDCKGLMQISERWHKDRMERLGVTDLYDTYGSMLLAADYITELYAIYQDLTAVLMKYNGDSHLEQYLETGIASDYAIDIINLSINLGRREENESTSDKDDCLQQTIRRIRKGSGESFRENNRATY